MSLEFNLYSLKNYFFHKEIRKSVLEPLTCIIRCATLNFLPLGTKISIIENKIKFIEPHILQGTIRWTQGDKREDLHNIYNPIIKATKWYPRENKDILNIFKLAKKGLEKLRKSYNDNSIISHSLSLYINIIDLYINTDKKCMEEYYNNIGNKSIKSMEKDKMNEEENQINKNLKNLWDETQISIINNIFLQIEKYTDNKNETDNSNSDDWLKALNIILQNKEKCVYDIIEKNTTILN